MLSLAGCTGSCYRCDGRRRCLGAVHNPFLPFAILISCSSLCSEQRVMGLGSDSC